MTILSAQSIRRRQMKALRESNGERGLFEPFAERTAAHRMTYGLGPAGYDVRIAETFTLAPGAFALASTIERFNMPTDTLASVADKSTWARRGLSAQNTIIEPGWTGFLTLELHNQGSEWLHFVEGMPIVQIIFYLLDEPTEQPYSGKYQDQPPGICPPRDEPPPTLGITILDGRGDEPTVIMLNGKRIGYVDEETNWLHMIGADGFATPICEVRDKEDIGRAVSAHYARGELC